MRPDGGPAFPRNPDKGDEMDFGSHGMSLRDYFAAHAPHSARPPAPRRNPFDFTDTTPLPKIDEAAWRYAYADAMLRERAKRVKG